VARRDRASTVERAGGSRVPPLTSAAGWRLARALRAGRPADSPDRAARTGMGCRRGRAADGRGCGAIVRQRCRAQGLIAAAWRAGGTPRMRDNLARIASAGRVGDETSPPDAQCNSPDSSLWCWRPARPGGLRNWASSDGAVRLCFATGSISSALLMSSRLSGDIMSQSTVSPFSHWPRRAATRRRPRCWQSPN
jgi:hypothetical protein